MLISNLDSDLDRTSIKQAFYFTDLTSPSISFSLKKLRLGIHLPLFSQVQLHIFVQNMYLYMGE